MDDLTFRGLFGPQRDYPYFGEPAFPADGGGFDVVRARWLAEASLLAYVPEEDRVREAWSRAGFADVAFFHRRSTFGFVANREGTTVVAFRGTEADDPEDLRTDVRVWLTESGREGRVHRGFKEALDLVWEEMAARMGARAWFTGHSLGAALATLAAARHGAAAGLYTFGSPRVGDAAFRDSIACPAFRVVNNNDLVCRVPPPAPYHHVGELCYLDRDGRLRRDPGLWDRVRDQVAGHADRANETVRRWLGGDWNTIAYDSLIDHSPLHYATLLRRAQDDR